MNQNIQINWHKKRKPGNITSTGFLRKLKTKLNYILMTTERQKGLIKIEKNTLNTLLKHIKGYFHKKGRILLVRETFFPYFCRSTIKKKEYEYKTEKIYFTGR